MLEIDPDTLSKPEREDIMCKLIEAECDLRYYGVRHNDVSPRNGIISSATTLTDPGLRVTLVDYGSSVVFRIRCARPPLSELRNPLFE